MKSRVLRALALGLVVVALASPARAQVTNFSADVNTAIDNGLEWLANAGYFAPLSTGNHGDAQGLVALALLEKRQNADQNSIGQGYALANATDQARIQAVIGGIIATSGHSFFSYVNGQEMMALSLYLRTGGPNQAGALAALNSVFDASMNVGAYGGACVDDGWGGCQVGGFVGTVGANTAAWHGYWCYTDASCRDASTTQFVMSGLAAARSVYGPSGHAPDAGRAATLDAVAARSAAAYAANGVNVGCAPGGILTGSELGHAYQQPNGTGACGSSGSTTFHQTGSGIWIQLVGGYDLNSPGVQGYLEWLRNRYRYTDLSGNEWSSLSYGYSMWTTSKAFAFLESSGVLPTGSNLSTASLGALTGGASPAYASRQTHLDPATAPRPAVFGPGAPGYYASPNEPARWYFDYAHTIISRQNADGSFQFPNGHWGYSAAEQAYHILVLQRSVGGGCVDTDGDGACDADDNCPQAANEDQADGDHDGLGDACDACPTDASNDADGDGVCGAVDNCPADANANQADADADGLGDACDACPNDAGNDADADGVCGDVDNCPAAANGDQADGDGDGLGDACDACPADASNDADGDGVCGGVDNCPNVANANQADADGDGVGDACDNCVTTANADQADANGNGIGDACEATGRMTGGGSVFTAAGVRVTHGMTLMCRVGVGSNNLQINWGKGNRFHLSGLTSASCSDDPAISSGNPAAGFDTLVGTGAGSHNGVAGATVSFTFTDAGEPGRNDTATIVVKDAGGATVLTVSGKLNNGNQQAH